MEIEVQRVIRLWQTLHELRREVLHGKWPLEWFDYAFTRVEQDTPEKGRALAYANLQTLRYELAARLEAERTADQMQALRHELVKTQQKIETSNDLLNTVNDHHENAATKEANREDEERRWRVTTEKTSERRYRLSLWWGAVTFFAGGIVLPWLVRWYHG